MKPTTINDVDLLLKMDKQEITQKYLGGIKNKTKEERISFLQKKQDKFQKGIAGSLTVFLKDGTPIGINGLRINEETNTGEIGYIFDYDYCNKGYCTESTKALIDIGFNTLKLESISADIVEGNNSSKRVLEKLGFKLDGKIEKNSTNFLIYKKRGDKNE